MKLTPLDMDVADHIGRQRDRYAASQRYNSRHTEVGKSHKSLDNHIIGVRAELAVARILRLPWQPNVGTIEGTDVGADVEVRCRRLRTVTQMDTAANVIGRGLLTLHPRDRGKEFKAFVLVHQCQDDPPDILRAIGWRLGLDVLQDRYWQDDPDMPTGVYRLPHDELIGMSRLIELLDYRHEQRYDEQLASYINGDTEQSGRSVGGRARRSRG